jgi:phosphatidyl-myo-inositol alpha-mannosyltransferase
MAAGRAIVATRIEGYEDLLAGAACARLVDVDDPLALADAITFLLREPQQRRALGARGASFALDYDWGTIARRLESVYDRVLATPG